MMQLARPNGGRGRREGSALVLVFLVTTVLVLLSAGLHLVASRHAREIAMEVDEKRSFHLAEAALAEATTALRGGATGNVGTQATPAELGAGLLWVEAADLGNKRTQLVAFAAVGSGRARLEAIVEDKSTEPLFEVVVNSKEQLTLNADVVVDSYASDIGTYASQVASSYLGVPYANDEGDVRSNADIVLNANAMVFGDAIPGPGHGVSLAAGSYVDGSITPAPMPAQFSPIQTPAVASAGPWALGPNGVATIPSGVHGFDSLTIGKDATLTVQGPATIVVDDFAGGKDANLMIDATAGPVTFFVRNGYLHENGFETDAVAGSPAAVAFMIEGTSPITFPSSSKIRGAYYAPDSDITFTANNEAWGAFAGKSVSMSSSMRFHYDEVLAEYWQDASGSSITPFEILAWYPTEIVPAMMKSNRGDPFTLLGAQPGGQPSPADAWDV